MVDNKYAIEVSGVYKEFLLPHEKTSSLKGKFTSIFQSNAWLTKETQHALQDVSFKIKKGEFFGIVGRNGSGKSTLLKILAGIYQPNVGSVKVTGKLVPFIELGVGFSPELTGRENVYLNGALLGFSQNEVDAMYQDIVDFAEIEKFMDQKLKNYSSGMQVRLAFSIATRSRADVLLVDEVLAVGDADFQRKCFDYFRTLKGAGTTVVFVTHDMNAIREYCDRAILIEDSRVIVEGTPSKVASRYTRLFMDKPSADGKKKSNDSKRWGDEALTYDSVSLSRSELMEETSLTIKMKATAHQDVEHPVFGFLIKNTAYTNIMGTNSQIKRQVIDILKKGESIEIEWEIPNIFNDGKYYIDPAIVYKGGSQISDWWEEAASFTVLKEDKTPYTVNPEVSFKHKKSIK